MARALARRIERFTNEVEVGDHTLLADEPPDVGGSNRGPRPTELLAASLAACTAITVEMYAERKGREVGDLEVEAGFESPERGATTRIAVTLRLPRGLSGEQAERLRVIAGKCPVHRILAGTVEIDDRVELR